MSQSPPVPRPAPFHTRRPWNPGQPQTLVIACSDGRLQEEVDAFLHTHLAITHYDRFYVPGGAGALTPSGVDFLRAQDLRRQCTALARAHEIKRAICLFHGPAPGGPDEAGCLDYARKLPGHSADRIRQQQDADARELLESGLGPGVALTAYRCEVRGDGRVQFVPLASG